MMVTNMSFHLKSVTVWLLWVMMESMHVGSIHGTSPTPVIRCAYPNHSMSRNVSDALRAQVACSPGFSTGVAGDI